MSPNDILKSKLLERNACFLALKSIRNLNNEKMHKVFLSSIKYCFHLTVFVINVFFVHLSIWGIIRESSKCSVSFTKYQISLKLENSINIFITFPIKINANSISMENGETKIKGQKQQFFSKVLFGLMTFFL